MTIARNVSTTFPSASVQASKKL
jgi:hypothetical protein